MTLSDKIKKQVVNDYFTPNIKAEVILDTLLTPHIEELVQNGHDGIKEDLRLIAKEMSILGKEGQGDWGPKIDYVLAGANTVYLVELKTTDSSTDDGQLSFYRSIIEDEQATFGNKLGKRLLDIRETHFGLSLKCRNGDQALKDAWTAIWEKRDRFEPREESFPEPKEGDPDHHHARAALALIKAKGWVWKSKQRSRKYVYTLGQLVDYLQTGTIWEKPLKVVYLTPDGDYPPEESKNILRVSLKREIPKLTAEGDDHDYIQMLQSIISKIYDKKEITP